MEKQIDRKVNRWINKKNIYIDKIDKCVVKKARYIDIMNR